MPEIVLSSENRISSQTYWEDYLVKCWHVVYVHSVSLFTNVNVPFHSVLSIQMLLYVFWISATFKGMEREYSNKQNVIFVIEQLCSVG